MTHAASGAGVGGGAVGQGSAVLNPPAVVVDSTTLEYQRLAEQIEHGLVDGPHNERFLKIGLRSKYRGM